MPSSARRCHHIKSGARAVPLTPCGAVNDQNAPALYRTVTVACRQGAEQAKAKVWASQLTL